MSLSPINQKSKISSKEAKRSLLNNLIKAIQDHITPSLQRGLAQRLNSNNKGTPLCTSYQKASYTVEAAVIMPLVLCLMISLIFLLKILVTTYCVQQELDAASRVMAISQSSVELSIPGLQSEGLNENYVDLVARYQVTFPIRMFGSQGFNVTQHSKNRKWVGFDPKEGALDSRYVYVTKFGSAYHNNYYCVYLNPSISTARVADLSSLRNSSGHKYYACSSCQAKSSDSDVIYITDYGESYHVSLGCSGLKRTIETISYEKAVILYHPCNKCG